jgi:hypothetical protein
MSWKEDSLFESGEPRLPEEEVSTGKQSVDDFELEMDEGTSMEEGINNYKFKERLNYLFEPTLHETQSDVGVEKELNNTLTDMDKEYREYFSLLGGLKKLAKYTPAGFTLGQLAKRISPSLRKRILGMAKGALKKYALKYGLKYGLPLIPGGGTAAAVAGPLLAKAGVPGLKDIFENEVGEPYSSEKKAENVEDFVRHAYQYAAENMEADSDDPLKANQLVNEAANHALTRLRETTNSGINPYVVNKTITLSPDTTYTITFRVKK